MSVTAVTIGTSKLDLAQGDITQQELEAIANAVNSRLAGGSGVDGAIHRAGGPSLMEELRAKYPQGCPTGQAVITGGGRLKAEPSLRHIPVIFLTAVVSREDLKAQAGLIGGRTFIAKPVSIKDLLQCIEQCPWYSRWREHALRDQNPSQTRPTTGARTDSGTPSVRRPCPAGHDLSNG